MGIEELAREHPREFERRLNLIVEFICDGKQFHNSALSIHADGEVAVLSTVLNSEVKVLFWGGLYSSLGGPTQKKEWPKEVERTFEALYGRAYAMHLRSIR